MRAVGYGLSQTVRPRYNMVRLRGNWCCSAYPATGEQNSVVQASLGLEFSRPLRPAANADQSIGPMVAIIFEVRPDKSVPAETRSRREVLARLTRDNDRSLLRESPRPRLRARLGRDVTATLARSLCPNTARRRLAWMRTNSIAARNDRGAVTTQVSRKNWQEDSMRPFN
jgi:hypothetical protein